MKHTIHLAFLFLLLIALPFRSLPAQTRDVFLLKWAPAPIFDPERESIWLNAEVRPLSKLGIEATWGIPLKYRRFPEQERFDRNYRILRGELRYYGWKFEGADIYTALEGFYVQEQYSIGSGSFISETGILIQFTSALIQRSVRGMGVKGGIVIPLGKYARFDFYMGSGMRVQNRDTTPEDPQTDPLLAWEGPNPRIEGRRVLPHFSAGVKLGFVIGKVPTEKPASR